MKKLFLLGAMVFSLLAAGCSSYKPVIFPFGKTYVYSVTFVNANGNVTSQCKIRMTTSEKKFHGQFGLQYDYDSCAGQPMYTERTGYDEDAGHVELHPPRMGALAFTEVVPFPRYHLPVGCMVSAKGEIAVARSTFSKANGKTIAYTYEQEGDTAVVFRGEHIECHKVSGENTNHYDDIGHYRVEYWFHPDFGFVRWEYTLPDGGVVRLMLE
jgi:hypothetical protein